MEVPTCAQVGHRVIETINVTGALTWGGGAGKREDLGLDLDFDGSVRLG